MTNCHFLELIWFFLIYVILLTSLKPFIAFVIILHHLFSLIFQLIPYFVLFFFFFSIHFHPYNNFNILDALLASFPSLNFIKYNLVYPIPLLHNSCLQCTIYSSIVSFHSIIVDSFPNIILSFKFELQGDITSNVA